MIAALKTSVMTVMLMAWTTLVFAQTPPAGGTPGTTSPSGTTTGQNPGGADGEGLNWIWIAIAVVVIAGLLFYFLGRRRTNNRI